MKLRLKGNTIRLRLSKSEVEALAANETVQEETQIGDTSFVYQLKKEATGELKAQLKNHVLAVSIPHDFANDWPLNNTVGIDNKQVDGSIPSLYIVIEKDFKCIDNTEEDQADNYDNPKAC
jgi:hypothetical protein